MRTSYLTKAKDLLVDALEKKDTLTTEEWTATAEEVLNNVRMTMLFARNSSSRGFLSTTNMSEAQVVETEQYKRLASLQSGEGCTLNITPDLYKYIRWIIKRDDPVVRLRTIKIGDNIISVSRIK